MRRIYRFMKKEFVAQLLNVPKLNAAYNSPAVVISTFYLRLFIRVSQFLILIVHL
jgi:hypothetical protein